LDPDAFVAHSGCRAKPEKFQAKVIHRRVIADFVRSYDWTVQGRQEANSAGGGENLRCLIETRNLNPQITQICADFLSA
jgi:hypothetical protein